MPTLMKLPFCLLALSCLALTLPARADTLYQRLGGQPGVEGIASQLIDRSAADPKTSRTFKEKVDLPRLKRLLAEQICVLSEGGCRYTGDSMKDVHAGLGISEAEFYGMVEHLREVLDAHDIRIADKNALLAKLAPMRRDIVEKRHDKR